MNPEILLDPAGSADQALLVRYYAGACDAVECERAEALIARSAAEQAFARAFAGIVIHGTPGLTGEEVRGALALWRRRTGASGVPARVAAGGAPVSMLSRTLGYVVASVVAAVLVVLTGYRGMARVHSGGHPSSVTTYATNNGQRANILLPDGSAVSLNAGSRLELPMDFGARHRTLTLSGEALFTVVHKQDVPFVVSVGSVVTRVLGTTFTVRRYPTDSTTQVAVRDGRVAVQNVIVAAGQLADVGRVGTVAVRTATPASFSFASGVLTLAGVPLRDAIPDLDRWFDADIHVADPALAEHHIDGTFAAGSVADLAAILQMTFEARVERTGRVLTIYSR